MAKYKYAGMTLTDLKKSKGGFSWIIDPIDGTRSYVSGNPTWSNLIALN